VPTEEDKEGSEKGGSEEEDMDGSKEEAKTGYLLPSFLPTFGVSAKTQLWIYGALVVIVAFIAAIAVYLVKQRRKQKARKENMDYEFEALNSEDIEEGVPQGQAPRGAGGRRKARDLYDAFGASDDEAELFSDDGDDDKEYYDDEEARGIDEGPREGDREKLLSRGKGNSDSVRH
jgi:kexin